MEKLSFRRTLAIRSNSSYLTGSHEQGAALLLGLLLVVIGGLSYFVSNLSSVGAKQAQNRSTETALMAAKNALMARAVTDGNRPGSLPCPDTDNDGLENQVAGNCTSGYTGRFPWQTLKTGELRDGNSEPLWYVLSSNLRDVAAAQPINRQTSTGMSLDGRTEIAAIIFSPGTPLTGQGGRPSNNRADYLDGANAVTANAFISGPLSDTFNDRMIAITRDELFQAVGQRVLSEIRGEDDSYPASPSGGLRRYQADYGDFPYADTNADGNPDTSAASGQVPNLSLVPISWLFNNQWFAHVSYQRVSAVCARLSLPGVATMSVVPCATSPCPTSTCP